MVVIRRIRSQIKQPRSPDDRPLPERGQRALARIRDEELITKYEALRDTAETRKILVEQAPPAAGSPLPAAASEAPAAHSSAAAAQKIPAAPAPRIVAGMPQSYPAIRKIAGTPFEREKDRREVRAALAAPQPPEMQQWYDEARRQPCTWWIEHHLVAKHALKSCMSCGVCASLCPAAEYYEEYNPRAIVDVALSGDEQQIVALLRSETLWYCGQCGSCVPRCTRRNHIMSLVSSLRQLAQLKGHHIASVRGRQQYAARHLWGGNFWNRACSLYFRNADPAAHPDFGPRFAEYRAKIDEEMLRLGANPDSDGRFGGRKVHPDTIAELRRCVQWGGTLALWREIEEAAIADARAEGLDLDSYHDAVKSEG